MHDSRAVAGRCLVAMKRISLALGIAFAAVTVVIPFTLLNCVDRVERQHTMDVNKIKTELGTVVGQLLEYQYRFVPRSHQRKGETSASVSARGWVESIVSGEFQPKGDVGEGFHSGGPDSCDAVQVRYPVVGDLGEIDLRISQTVFVITVSAKPKVWPSNWKNDPERAASELGHRIFIQPERLRLRRVRDLSGLSWGEQIIPPGKLPDQKDWLDTLRWWSDGSEVGFTVLKRTGPGQAAKISSDLQPNQVWFEMFERPRAR